MLSSLRSRARQLLAAVLCVAAAACAPSAAHAQAGPATPECFPYINGQHYGAPKVHIGDHGKFVFWACTPGTLSQARIHYFMCVHGQCSDEIHRTAMQFLIASSGSGAAGRIGAAKTMYRRYATIDCEALAQVQQATNEELPAWRACDEARGLLWAFARTWFPAYPWGTGQ